MVKKEFKIAYQIETPVVLLPLERGRLVSWREDWGIRKLLPADREEEIYMHVSAATYVYIHVIYFNDIYISGISFYLSIHLMASNQ